MIITDKGLIKAGVVAKITESLDIAKIEYTIFDKIEPNPRDMTVQSAYEEAIRFQCDMLVAIGEEALWIQQKG